LLLFASDLMHKGDALPLVSADASLQDLLLEMSTKSLGMAGVVDETGKLLGMFTDGDLRRTLNDGVDIYNNKAIDLVKKDPFTITADTLAAEIVKIMRDYAQQGPHAINSLFVVNNQGTVVGALNTHDLLRAGVI
jgi:arabinose-5-phosphate isomerase